MDPNHNRNVVNYSSTPLEPEHITLLERGLKFCPSPGKPNLGEFRDDIDRLHTRLRQMAFFENPENSYSTQDTEINHDSINATPEPFEDRKFRLKSNFKGCQTSNNLEAFIIANENDFNSKKPSTKFYRRNITKSENTALKQLSQNFTS